MGRGRGRAGRWQRHHHRARSGAHDPRLLGLHPRRTLRVVFWTNEENGGAGGDAYRAMVGDTVKNHVAAIEMDGGAEKPAGFGVSAGGDMQCMLARVREIGRAAAPHRRRIRSAGRRRRRHRARSCATVSPGWALRTVGTHYFDWHHTARRYRGQSQPGGFARNIAAMAVMAYVLADMPAPLRQVTSSTR